MVRKIESAAPVLLKACRRAIRLLMEDGFTEARRTIVLDILTSAVEKAEASSFDGNVRFTTTHKTATALKNAVAALPESSAKRNLAAAISGGARETKQRVYFKLAADYELMRLLSNTLDKSSLHGTKRAFDRIVRQIEREVLSKSPLQHLADTGF